MNHYLDLHIHSRYSRATSPALTPANLSLWAGYKGIRLVGTGDLTHPGWLAELETSLAPRDDGFYSLKDQPHGVRFIPTGEVSAIYKQDGRTRKIHLVIIAPDLPAAAKFSQTLGRLGNVESDGRPILGLSAHDLLDIALRTHPEMVVVPAHIWTPWFSLFGAKSGFDRLEDCFGDLSPHITALETGLSSDPAMNRLVSALDRYALISSSDAHSPDKLGREATILTGPLERNNLWAALQGGPGLAGTLEFFPEEGKYHLDGHLGCGPALTPEETRALGGLCPVCGRPVTIGVLHRVTELADRDEPLAERLPDHHLIPLPEILGQVFGQGSATKKVTGALERLVNEFGNEFTLLLETPLADIEAAAGPLLRLAVDRMRRGEVEAEGGFDGRFGTVLVVKPEDRDEYSGQGSLFETSPARPPKPRPRLAAPAPALEPEGDITPTTEYAIPMISAKPEIMGLGRPRSDFASCRVDNSLPLWPSLALVQGDPLLDGLDEDQKRAVTHRGPTLSLVAGPGGGKTRVLIHRAAWLIREGLVAPEETLLTTYTRKAAQELGPRLTAALPFRPESRRVRVVTLHALAYDFLKSRHPDWDLASEDFLTGLAQTAGQKAGLKGPAFQALLSLVKNGPQPPGEGETAWPPGAPPGFPAAYHWYHQTLAAHQKWDFDDLITRAAPAGPPPFKAVLVDEFQDFSEAQFGFLQKLLPPGSLHARLTVIGDPDQSIYGFRGARSDIFDRLTVYPQLTTVELAANYRSSRTLVQAGEAVLARPGRPPRRAARPETGPRLTRATLATPRREAAYVVSRLSAHLGVLKLGLEGGARQDAEFMPGLNFNDVAVLFRLRSLGASVAEGLSSAGLPWQMCGPDPLTAADDLDWTADKISLLTMHAAKGLEFKLVFVIGAEEGLCPYLAPGEENDPARTAEEKRLFYVALTRAKDRLYLTRARDRRLYGQPLAGRPSPFWSLPPDGLCQDVTPKLKAARPQTRPTLFD